MAQHPNHGGPAFPIQNAQFTEAYGGAPGMTLRDWFAGQALAGYVANTEIHDTNAPTMARDCYAIADAFLAERNLPPEVRS
jgi:hypothetical protein